jgi:hypothetical protein
MRKAFLSKKIEFITEDYFVQHVNNTTLLLNLFGNIYTKDN